MAKLKPLRPTLREKKRYLVFEVISKQPLAHAKDIAKAINQSLLNLVGSLGAGRAGLLFLHDKYNQKAQKGIVRVTHTSVDQLLTALTLTTTVNNNPVIIRSVGVSGIMKKAIANYL